jgi:hypothetical protein
LVRGRSGSPKRGGADERKADEARTDLEKTINNVKDKLKSAEQVIPKYYKEYKDNSKEGKETVNGILGEGVGE